MNVFLDSDVIIDTIRYKHPLNSKNYYFINPVVYAEVMYGVLYSNKKPAEFDVFLYENAITTVDITTNTGLVLAKNKLILNMAGIRIEDNDLFIAASCIEHKMKLLTRNFKHFERIKEIKFARL